MTVEALLAYAHILLILMAATFLASEAALCRMEWMNVAVVERLVRVDRLFGVSALGLLASGLARAFWGIRGPGWYWMQPLLYVKIGLFLAVGAMSLMPTMRYLQWRRDARASGTLPTPEQVRATRRLVMIEAHVLVVIPLLAAFLAHPGSY